MGRALAVAVLVAAGALAGCGGARPTPSGAELASEGDRICAETRARAERIQQRPPRTRAEAIAQSEALAELLADEADRLAALEGPEARLRRLDAYLAARRDAVELVRRGAEAARRDRPRLYLRLQRRFEAGVAERRRLALAVGFEVCSRPPGPERGSGG